MIVMQHRNAFPDIVWKVIIALPLTKTYRKDEGGGIISKARGTMRHLCIYLIPILSYPAIY